ATPAPYTLSLHDALPISRGGRTGLLQNQLAGPVAPVAAPLPRPPLTAVATVAEIPAGNPVYAGSAAPRRVAVRPAGNARQCVHGQRAGVLPAASTSAISE